MIIENISSNKVFNGWHKQYSHASNVLHCNMRFAIFLPPQATAVNKVPVVYWLSGLTCNDENFMQKAGALKIAAELGIAIVVPDTSPRGNDVPDNKEYDLGMGAGFYVNATQAPWNTHYQMYDYVLHELPKLIEAHFPVNDVRSISGHSMGGHGALVLALRNPEVYRSVSAFSPICDPLHCPWGTKAMRAYLGDNTDTWAKYNASELIKKTKSTLPIRIEQGESDPFLSDQLHPQTFIDAAKVNNHPIIFNLQPGFDHSYYFISSFIEDHLRFHALYLKS
ncbi:S-formylglutathione hydrolase [Psychromonas sp. CNPT3]|uniref:S-formylglutathione hydrolase n=1 Tax=Psychromonas sp. CNPT3 TaxID=314282 RepID=UPI00006E76A5|nr:S-formylglutathione hydrolase [Psychromonas sp. CNPT3]AGH80603.1 S-formylglutathione hydrolase [Psychromonas sp. CNPT3]